jgi:prolyl-tRNA editing enzyme YbaK/EbsC (Cys-tRNA(Pro) deacylase)
MAARGGVCFCLDRESCLVTAGLMVGPWVCLFMALTILPLGVDPRPSRAPSRVTAPLRLGGRSRVRMSVLYLSSMTEASEQLRDPKVDRVVEAGRALGIEVTPVIFDEETRTAADAARKVGCDVAQIVKSLVFEGEGRPILFLVSGANRVDLAKGAAAAGVDALDKADAQAARAATGFSIGATPPFGHVSEIPLFMDADLLAFDEVWAAAGRPDSVFPVNPKKLQNATGAVVADMRA